MNYHFGNELNKYLRNKGITDSWLANKIGISNQAVRNYFKAENPRKETVNKILSALGITIEILIAEVNETTSDPIAEYKITSKPTIEISLEQYDYFLQAMKERDELKNKEIERLQEANRAMPEKH